MGTLRPMEIHFNKKKTILIRIEIDTINIIVVRRAFNGNFNIEANETKIENNCRNVLSGSMCVFSIFFDTFSVVPNGSSTHYGCNCVIYFRFGCRNV